MKLRLVVTFLAALLVAAILAGCLEDAPNASVYGYEIVGIYPHDPDAFTQGLIFHDGLLYESTGLYGRSSLRRVDLETGVVLESRSLSPRLFGEGLTLWEDRLIQLTWLSGRGFVWDRESLTLEGSFTYPGEGWGITHDGERLIMSDGSSKLRLLDPQTFREVGRIEARDEGAPVFGINELEYVGGEIYANVWKTDEIVRISPKTGRVLGRIDLSGLLTPEERGQASILNGIAYDPEGDRLFVTGKLWPKLFEIELFPR